MRLPARRHDRPLDLLFAAPSHMAVPRSLTEFDDGLNVRQLGRVAGITHQAARMAVARLDALGVIRREGAGHSPRLFLDVANDIVRLAVLPLLEADEKLAAKAELRRREALLARARGIMGRG